MPQPPTTYMGLVQPTEGGDDDVWDTLLTAVFLLIDAHDHTTGQGFPLGSASLTIDDDLEFNDNRATELTGAAFTNLGGLLAAGSRELFSFGSNLYFRNGAGVNVRITNGNALDVTTVGAIAGDYTSIGAEVAYVDASDTYTFKQETAAAVRQFARLQSGDVRLMEYKAAGDPAVPTTFVGLASPAALPGSYTLTMPSALPGSTQILQVSSAGAVTASNTIANAVSMSSTLGVTGLITATAGLTAAVDQHVTVSGTGQFKHGDRVRVISPLGGQGSTFSLNAGYVVSAGAGVWYVPVDLNEGERLTALSYGIYGDASADVTVTVTLYDSTGAATVLGSASVLNQAATWTRYAIAGLTAHTIATADQIVVDFVPSAANLRVGAIRATYTRP